MPKVKLAESVFGISSEEARERLTILTPREREIAEITAKGVPNPKIAAELGMSRKTLDVHRAMIKRKLGCKTSVEIAKLIFAEKFGGFEK